MIFALSACAAPPAGGPTPRSPPPGRDAVDLDTPPCGPDTLEIDGRCVDPRCGTTRFGALDPGGFDVFVDPAAAPGGDGSADAPLASFAEAAAGLGGTGAIALAAGTHVAPPRLGEVRDLRIAGRCADLVSITHSGDPEGSLNTLRMETEGGRLVLEDLTLTRGLLGGLSVYGGAAALRRVDLVDNELWGLVVASPEGVDAADVRVTGTGLPGLVAGVGIGVARGGVLRGERVSSTGNLDLALQILGSGEVTLTDAVLETPDPPLEGYVATALEVASKGRLHCTRCRIGDGPGHGAVVDGQESVLRLVDSEIGGLTLGRGDLGASVAAWARQGGTLEAEGLLVEDVEGIGVAVGEWSSATLVDTRITAVRPAPGEGGSSGITVFAGGALAAEGLAIERVEGWGLHAFDAGTRVDVADLQLVDLGAAAAPSPSSSEAPGGGVAVTFDAVATLDGVRARGVEGPAVTVSGARALVSNVDLDGFLPNLGSEGGGALLGPALLVGSHAVLHVAGGTVAGGVGLGAVALGGALSLADLTFTGTRSATGVGVGTDLYAADGARVDASRVRFESVLAHGVLARGEGVVVAVSDSRIGGALGHGLIGIDGATLEIADTTVSERTTFGVVVDGGRQTLRESVVERTRDGATSRLGVGVAVLGGAVATLDGLAARDTDGIGLVVHDAAATCADCAVSGAELVGVYARAADLSLDGGAVTDTRAVDGEGSFGLVIDAVDAAPRVTLAGVRVSGHPSVAVWLEGPADYDLQDVDLVGGAPYRLRAGIDVHGDALVARGGITSSDLRLVDATVRDAGGAGLLLHGASATLDGVTLTGNATDVVQQACADDAPDPVQGVPPDATSARCVGADRLLLPPDLSFVVELGPVLSE